MIMMMIPPHGCAAPFSGCVCTYVLRVRLLCLWCGVHPPRRDRDRWAAWGARFDRPTEPRRGLLLLSPRGPRRCRRAGARRGHAVRQARALLVAGRAVRGGSTGPGAGRGEGQRGLRGGTTDGAWAVGTRAEARFNKGAPGVPARARTAAAAGSGGGGPARERTSQERRKCERCSSCERGTRARARRVICAASPGRDLPRLGHGTDWEGMGIGKVGREEKGAGAGPGHMGARHAAALRQPVETHPSCHHPPSRSDFETYLRRTVARASVQPAHPPGHQTSKAAARNSPASLAVVGARARRARENQRMCLSSRARICVCIIIRSLLRPAQPPAA